MIPNVSSAINTLSQRILANVLPTIDSTYVVSDTAMLAMLLTALANEAEAGVANRLADIAAMVVIFEHAKKQGLDVPELNSNPATMTLTDVNTCHDSMTKALIDLHAKVEAQADCEQLNATIWDYLHQASERHALMI